MRLIEKVKRLEKNIHRTEEPLGIAIRYLDGRINWNDRIWEDERAFKTAVEEAFKGHPPSNVPRAIIVSYYREFPATAQS